MTINDINRQVCLLSRDQEYTFRNSANRNEFKFVKRDASTHALHFVRIQGDKQSQVTVSERNLAKIAAKVRAYVPFQIDVIVGASGNWRSLFESALAYTPQFYACMLNNQRHLIWAPDHPHALNVLCEADAAMLQVFAKQSRFYDFQYFICNCYPFSDCYEHFKNGLTELLRIFRRFNANLRSVYDISDVDQLESLINTAEDECSQDFHAPLPTNAHFSLFDVAQAYLNFLTAKNYFAFY